jgi:predicted ATPase
MAKDTLSGRPCLQRIAIEGYRSLRSIDLRDIGRVTVLIGANGGGKSNLLDALALVAHLRTSSLQRFVGDRGGASSLLHYGSDRTREIKLRLEFDEKRPGGELASNAYEATLGYAAGDSLIFLDEQVGYRRAGSDWRMHSLGRSGHQETALAEYRDKTTARTTLHLLGGLSYFHFHDTSTQSLIRANSRAEDNRYLRSDGSNLAAYLLALAEDPGAAAAWQRILALVQRAAPFVKDLAPRYTNAAKTHVRLDWLDDRDGIFGPHHLSDGTLRAIALLTALGQPGERLPLYSSIDEPELGLHPAAVTILCDLMKSVAERCQLFLATQSPALLDHFASDTVVVAERRSGETVFTRPDAARLKSWLEDYTLAELWDKNVLGGRP